MKDNSTFRVVDASKRGWAGGTRRNVCGAGSSNAGGEADCASETRDNSLLLTLPRALCHPVARGLIALILHMDFTCNIDMFLLACKVLARIIWCSRPALPLGDVMSNDQLLKLIRMAVWQDPHQSSWGGPWAAHAITCLLQDVLDGVRSAPIPTTSREGSPSEEFTESRPGSSQSASAQRASFDKLRGPSG